MKRLFFFWIMYPLDLLADILSEYHVPRHFEPCTFGMNVPGEKSQRRPLNFMQLSWCDKELRHFKSMREQAEAARGSTPAAVVTVQ